MYKFKQLFLYIKKLLTHNKCDTCGLTKNKVYVSELFMEAGFIQCEQCINGKCI